MRFPRSARPSAKRRTFSRVARAISSDVPVVAERIEIVQKGEGLQNPAWPTTNDVADSDYGSQ